MPYRLLLAENTVQAANVVASTAAETAFASVVPIPGNTDVLSRAGRFYRLRADGYMGSLVTTPGTLTLKIKWGSTILASTGAVQLPASAMTNKHWEFVAGILVATTGTSGKIACQGGGLIDANGAPISFGFVNTGTGATGQITVNTQTAANISVTAQFSISDAANTITLAQLLVEQLAG